MKPRELIKALMTQQGLGTLPLAKRMGRPELQSHIHRFLKGDIAEPKRDTATALANYFRIPVDAIYDQRTATQVAQERLTVVADGPAALPPAPDHWRRVADELAKQLREEQLKVDAEKFLTATDTLADIIPPNASEKVVEEQVARIRKLLA